MSKAAKSITKSGSVSRARRDRVLSQFDKYPLPFFDKAEGLTWAVKPTGHYTADCDTGRDYARQFLATCDGSVGWGSLLTCIVSGIVRMGPERTWPDGSVSCGGIVTGFMGEIGRTLNTGTRHTAAKAGASSNDAALAEMRALAAQLPALRAAFIAANERYNKIETAYFAARPAQPDFSVGMPPDVLKAFKTLTVNQVAVLPANHPYIVWEREHEAAQHAAYEEWRTACERVKMQFPELETAEAESDAAANRLDNASLKVLAIKATGIEAIALKVLAKRLSDFDPTADKIEGDLLACIDATAELAGYDTGKSVV